MKGEIYASYLRFQAFSIPVVPDMYGEHTNAYVEEVSFVEQTHTHTHIHTCDF